VTEAIVHLPLLTIAEYLVGLVDLFKAFLGVGSLVHVRVILPRQLAIGAFDRIFVGVARDAQHFIVIAFAHC